METKSRNLFEPYFFACALLRFHVEQNYAKTAKQMKLKSIKMLFHKIYARLRGRLLICGPLMASMGNVVARVCNYNSCSSNPVILITNLRHEVRMRRRQKTIVGFRFLLWIIVFRENYTLEVG